MEVDCRLIYGWQLTFIQSKKIYDWIHPYVAAEQANAIEDGESSELEKYIILCAECESIAVQIHPSYKEKLEYVDVAAKIDEHATRHC